MNKIKNEAYRAFLDNGIIKTLSEEDLKNAMRSIRGKFKAHGQALLTVLYYTGARPVEVLNIKAKDVSREKGYIVIQLKGSKRGLPRPVYLPANKDLIKEFYSFTLGVYPEFYLFYPFRNAYIRKTMNKKGQEKTRTEITDKLRYYFKHWFENVIPGSIPPYFLRHNRFSKLSMKGASLEEMRQLKGSRTYNSIMPYVHLSTETAKKISKKIE